MNKHILLSVLIIMLLTMSSCVFMFTGCSSNEDADAGSEDAEISTEEAAPEESDTSADDQASGDWKDIEEQPEIDISLLGGEGGVEVDLSKLSSTMVYAVVNDMLTRPNDYIGRSIRMNGAMSVYYEEESGNTYYACIIKDATACCAQGIEFVTTDEYPPESYPADGEDVTVVGTYDLYDDNGVMYCVLKDAVLE